MITPKEYYRNYLASDELAPLNFKLTEFISVYNPIHVLEFGSGTGKNLRLLKGIEGCAMDLSLLNAIHARTRNDIPFTICGDETHLRHLCNFDVVFTCSVLDHIEDIDGIIQEFKRIANKAIFLAETNDTPYQYYYPHDYESYGFVKLNYEWQSYADGATYHIWYLNKTL